MSFSELLSAIAAFAHDPDGTRAAWRRRRAFRAELRRLIDQPNLLADVDFDPSAARAEVARKPWQEVAIRRSAAPAAPAPRRPVAALTETGCTSSTASA